MPELTKSKSAHPAYMTRREAATFLGIDSRTLANWAHRCCGPRFYKVGHAARYRMDDLEAWLESRVVECDQAGND